VWWSAPVFYFANKNCWKFKLNSNEFVNYKVFRIIERIFLILYLLGLKSTLSPSQPTPQPTEAFPLGAVCTAQLLAQPWPGAPAGAMDQSSRRVHTRSANPNLSSYPLRPFAQNWVYPLSDFSLSYAIWSQFWDRLVRILNPLRVGIKTAINRWAFVCNFLEKLSQALAVTLPCCHASVMPPVPSQPSRKLPRGPSLSSVPSPSLESHKRSRLPSLKLEGERPPSPAATAACVVQRCAKQHSRLAMMS
jgi:hypothetical protein